MRGRTGGSASDNRYSGTAAFDWVAFGLAEVPVPRYFGAAATERDDVAHGARRAVVVAEYAKQRAAEVLRHLDRRVVARAPLSLTCWDRAGLQRVFLDLNSGHARRGNIATARERCGYDFPPVGPVAAATVEDFCYVTAANAAQEGRQKFKDKAKPD